MSKRNNSKTEKQEIHKSNYTRWLKSGKIVRTTSVFWFCFRCQNLGGFVSM